MSDDDEDVEWEYEDESDGGAAETEAEAPEQEHGGGDEEDEGVDWEDAEQPADEPGPSQELHEDDGDDAEKAVSDLNAINWDHINSVLQREAEKENGDAKPKRKVVRMTKQDKEHALAVHKTHLLLLLATLRELNQLCQSRLLGGIMLSLTSKSSVDFFREAPEMALKDLCELLVRWFHQQFQVAHSSSVGSQGGVDDLSENALMGVASDRKGTPTHLALLFVVLCRAIGLHTRVTMVMDPLVVQQHSKAAESALTSIPTTPQAYRKRTRDGVTEQPTAPAPPTKSLWTWGEIYDQRSKRWVMVDVVHRVVNRPADVGALRSKGSPFSYIVSIDHDGFLVDVTPRYVERWSKSMSLRLAHAWLLRSLELLNERLKTAASAEEQQPRDDEREKLKQLTESEAMPGTFEGFKKHHLYCLERHLGRFECIHPKKAIGLFKGHPVYLRKSVQTTRSWFQWRRLGREVREYERDRPAKLQGRSSAKDGDESDSGGDSAGLVAASKGDGTRRALYGFWQTDEINPPTVDGVTVPKNPYGNIELWSPAHLPIGAIHLQLPRIEKVAQQLGVDYAPAVIGFEVKNGKNYPKFDGIVVAKAVAETLLDAHAHVQQTLIEKAINKNLQLVLKRWERLVKRLLLKQRLNEEYGEL